MSLSFSLTEPGEGRSLNISSNETSHSFHLFYPCQSQSSCSSYFSIFPPGSFKLEIFGSQGGSFVSGLGGLGGYSQGVLSLSEPTHVFLVVGGRSQSLEVSGNSNSETSFNGGGKSGYSSSQYSGSPGGGSSDFRIEIDDYFHRVIVAGGGGGGGQWGSGSAYQGGFGGGETGGDGMKHYSGHTGSKGGTQSSGGSGGDYSGHFQSPGVFGIGSDTLYQGSGGGGGWYGGSGGLDGGSGGGGGSGYVNTASSQKPSFYPFNDKYFLEESSTIPNINTGQGHIIVTILSLSSSNFIIISQCPTSHFPLSCFAVMLFLS